MNLAKQLLFIGIFFVILAMTTARLNKSCQINQIIMNGDFEVKCKRERTGIYVDIICRNDNWTDFSNIKLNVPFVQELDFSNCSFPETLNLANVINSLGVNSTYKLGIKHLLTTPNRHTFQGLSISHMTISFSNLTEIPFDMLHGVSGIESLVIMNSNIRLFPKNFFTKWTKDLETLHLLMNKLEKITKDDFAELDNVCSMNLYGNGVTEIEAGAFDHLTRLSVLDLARNLLRTLPSGIFRHLNALDRLHLSQNPFEELPSDLFTGIRDCHLSHFRMSFINGSLKTLPNGFFKNLKDLKDVQLQGNQLDSLPPDLFAGTSELVNLNLQNNYLKDLPSGLFKSLTKLQKLDLANNQIVTLPAGIFEGLFFLDNLDISYNNLTTLSSDVLVGLNTVTIFNASHNYLNKVDDDLCQCLGAVQVIDFSFNQLSFQANRSYLNTGDTSIFMACEKLRNIYLSNNKATQIFVDFVNRQYIDLSNNHLSEITAKDMEYLNPIGTTLDLQNNQISKINLTELPSVVARYLSHSNELSYRNLKIMLGGNPLHCDCHLIDFINYWKSEDNGTFRQFVKLTASDADGGSILCASPAEFENRDISSIRPEELNCPLKKDSIEDACSNTCICREYPAKQVLSMDCSYRNLTQLPTTITMPRGWSIELNMSHNVLSETPSMKHHLQNVSSLDLSHNEISTVRSDVFSSSLVDLRLDHNKISRLEARVVDYLSNDQVLRRLTLHGNKWICDCKARNFYSFVQRKAMEFELFQVTCSETKVKLYAITMSELCNDLLLTIIVMSLAIAMIAIIVGSVFALHCRHNHEITVSPYTKQWYIKLFTNNELGKHHKYDAFINSSGKNKDFAQKKMMVQLEDLKS